MVTARSHARASAGPLRLLGLAALLLGLFWTHVADAHGVAGHLGAGPTVSVRAASAAPSPGSSYAHAATPVSGPALGPVPASLAPADGHAPAHPAHECVPLPPRQGSAGDAPPAGLPVAPWCSADGPAYPHAGGGSRPFLSAAPPSGAPAVLRL
ncbi:hypothetical protein OOK31_15570 [Streptomyces sp. NBC_00249]|uniref:hypothetical protein n=1 Tax=Streptomyces sp. NBC_00249 TaxID=2975690 RepID=UPI0022507300|nr:hypothetical protein [Streptomyces sp. NBC_00249]MCX5195306.1 hypothetical protein [Streptomyces sp. NBC_00249]